MRKFDAIQLGERAELRHVITEEDIRKFIELTGDDNKLHVDMEYARKTVFKKPVVHGMLGASFISTIIGTKLPGDGALWFAQNIEFLLPVRVGDELTIIAEVIRKVDRQNVIELQTDIYNQFRQKVTTGTAKVKLIEHEISSEVSDNKISEKIALVIGGTGGIGQAACLQLARDGFDIAVHYHGNEEKAKQIRDDIEKLGRKSIIIKADITDDTQVREMKERFIRKFSKLTALINCSTIKIPNINCLSLEWKDIQNQLDINVKGFFNLIMNFVPLMEKETYGKIVSITTQAIEAPNPQWLHYITAKSALNGFSKALAVELASKGIRVNMISPGMTETELIADLPEKVRLLAKAKTPLKRIATPEDIAGAISFLSSEKSDFLTGETIRVNGGQVML